jgi:hypothetical protein
MDKTLKLNKKGNWLAFLNSIPSLAASPPKHDTTHRHPIASSSLQQL